MSRLLRGEREKIMIVDCKLFQNRIWIKLKLQKETYFPSKLMTLLESVFCSYNNAYPFFFFLLYSVCKGSIFLFSIPSVKIALLQKFRTSHSEGIYMQFDHLQIIFNYCSFIFCYIKIKKKCTPVSKSLSL